MQGSNEKRIESFWSISKRSLQTVSSIKQEIVSETLISSQELNYLPYFKRQNQSQTPSVNAYSAIVQWVHTINTNENYQKYMHSNVEILDSIVTLWLL